jgi:hypothetical protein
MRHCRVGSVTIDANPEGINQYSGTERFARNASRTARVTAINKGPKHPDTKAAHHRAAQAHRAAATRATNKSDRAEHLHQAAYHETMS